MKEWFDNIEIEENTQYHPNLCACGCGGKIQIRKCHSWKSHGIPKYISGHNITFLGKKHSEETKLKQRLKKLGRTLPEEQKYKIGVSVKNSIHKENCACYICRSKNGLTKGENHPMYGKSPTEETRQKLKKSHTGKLGELASNWQGGISFLPYPSEFNKELKNFILERDEHKCQFPGCTKIHKQLHVHHIDYDKNNNNPDNLITLGVSCHTRTNGKKRKYWIGFYQNIMMGKVVECFL